jgi:hypothetical protein
MGIECTYIFPTFETLKPPIQCPLAKLSAFKPDRIETGHVLRSREIAMNLPRGDNFELLERSRNPNIHCNTLSKCDKHDVRGRYSVPVSSLSFTMFAMR